MTCLDITKFRNYLNNYHGAKTKFLLTFFFILEAITLISMALFGSFDWIKKYILAFDLVQIMERKGYQTNKNTSFVASGNRVLLLPVTKNNSLN